MWILEHDGDLFEGKKKWLRPGTRHLLGRTTRKADDPYQSHFIQQKSVSRQHLIITVGPEPAEEWANLNSTSTIEVSDDSKFGTTIDGEKFVKTTKFLTGKRRFVIKLGNWDLKFLLEWRPVVFTFSMLGRRKKGGEDPIASYRARLAALDIKADKHYRRGLTSHVVAEKRNTPEGLQALVNGKWIVTEEYITALEELATASSADDEAAGDSMPSKLEDDFEGCWPKEIQYLPTVGKEPVPRPAEMFAPSEARCQVYMGYTFIFCDDLQYEKLTPAIEDGSGKALLYELSPGDTTVEDFVRYVKSIVGEEGVGEFEDKSVGKGPVIVRTSGRKGDEDWTADFQRDTQLRLDQRSIEQNEFLDSIIMNDATVLRRRLPTDDTAPAASVEGTRNLEEPSVEATSSVVVNQTESAREGTVQRRKRPRTVITESRFKGFDDFDPSQIPKKIDEDDDISMMDSIPEASILPSQNSEGTQLPVSVSSRKRPYSGDHTTLDQENLVDQLAPAAAAMKRRKLQEQGEKAAAASEGDPTGTAKTSKTGHVDKMRKAQKGKEKDIDVREALRVEQEAREEAGRREAEEDDNIAPEEIEQLRNLAIVEEMEVKPRSDRPAKQGNNASDDRWDNRWNGRKNFKRFRRQGIAGGLRGQKVIVTLEEAKKKDYGIGEDYWLETTESRPKSTQDLTSQSSRKVIQESPIVIDDDGGEDEYAFRRNRSRRNTRPPSTIEESTGADHHHVEAVEDDDDDLVEISTLEPSPEETFASKKTGRQSKRSQTIVSDSQQTPATRAKGKRPAAEVPVTAEPEPATKKRVTARGRNATASSSAISRSKVEEEDDDEGAFKFKRRRG